jgi:methenyltetrahydromethanopterin cyclohydrolase
MLSVNELGFNVFDEMLDFSDELNLEVVELPNGATVIDAGVNTSGGFEAGIYLARLCLADLADLGLTTFDLGITLPAIQVTTDHPIIACMASQYAGWRIQVGKYFGMGSGPARALAKKPKRLYEEMGYEDSSNVAVLVLESNEIPNDVVTDEIADECGVNSSDLYIVVAPTASVAGSVQISARIVETGIHKLESIGFEINRVKHASGVAPIAPIVGDDVQCMGATNDCIIYCGRAFYHVDYENLEELREYIPRIPSSASKDYGKPFYATFKEAGFDFFKVDAGMFAPAEVTMNELKSGETFTSGKINPDVLLKSFEVKRL